jgi:hypothetical protein
MALTKNTNIKIYGVDVNFDSSYIKINSISGNKKSMAAFVETLSKVDGCLIESKQYSFDYDLNGENPIKQAYLHLKTLPEFADAVDC